MVIIDAGHGGSDPGGGSNQYWKEKDLNLKISLYEYERLRQLGVPVSLTRDRDISLNPTDRVLKVYSLADGNNDILISNIFGDLKEFFEYLEFSFYFRLYHYLVLDK